MIEQDQRDITGVVRAKLVAGTLPMVAPVRIWIRHGTGTLTCHACDLKVDGQDVQYQTDMPDGSTLTWHQACLTVWHQERAATFPAPDPICAVCEQPILLRDTVSGTRDDLVHARCRETPRRGGGA